MVILLQQWQQQQQPRQQQQQHSSGQGSSRAAAEGAAGGGASNIVIVTEVEENLNRVLDLISQLDKSIPNINIAVRFIENRFNNRNWTTEELNYKNLA